MTRSPIELFWTAKQTKIYRWSRTRADKNLNWKWIFYWFLCFHNCWTTRLVSINWKWTDSRAGNGGRGSYCLHSCGRERGQIVLLKYQPSIDLHFVMAARRKRFNCSSVAHHDDHHHYNVNQVKEGERVDMSCPSPRPWFLCIWRSPAQVIISHDCPDRVKSSWYDSGASMWDPAKCQGTSICVQQHKVLPFYQTSSPELLCFWED